MGRFHKVLRERFICLEQETQSHSLWLQHPNVLKLNQRGKLIISSYVSTTQFDLYNTTKVYLAPSVQASLHKIYTTSVTQGNYLQIPEMGVA